MKCIVVGGGGRLGRALVERLRSTHDVIAADIAGSEVVPLDVTDFAAVRALIHQEQPHIVLHPAAWTDVDGCAREPERAITVNGQGAGNVAVAAAEVGAAMLYVSSNEVFPGDGARPYREYDATRPINPYGYSKWVGEHEVQRHNPRHYIVRTAWLFAHGGKNFIQSILNAAADGKPIRVVTNEVANPTYNDDLADAIVRLIETGRYGTYHLVNSGACSRYAFARYVLDRAGYADTPISPISASQWQRPSTPPSYAAMDNLLGTMLGITLRPWQEAADAFLTREGLLHIS